ncbi:MAG: chorismate synthase [Clostridia bacterium]|nr:chorismate synthase [Clostridia bacterium]
MADTYGKLFRITLFGESHSAAIGVVIDGVPAGISLDLDEIGREMSRRAPGKDAMSTPRKEADIPQIVSGFFEGKTTGTALCAIIENTNTRSGDYEPDLLRPAHADFTGKARYEGYNDYRGGGHFSGRLTAPLVFAGAVAKQFLAGCGVSVCAHLQSVADIFDAPFDACAPKMDEKTLSARELPVLDESVIEQMKQAILSAKADGDSVGGCVECAIVGLPVGVGSPFFESVESRLSSMLFSVPAVKGVEFGTGFAISKLRGSEANDSFYLDNGEIKTRTNHNGGLNGGITNGMPVIFRAAIKPTPSIAKEQMTVNIAEMKECSMRVHGRHDPCIAHRAVCVIEAAAAIVAADLLLEAKSYGK